MKERYLTISAQLWIDILKTTREQHFRVIKNGLPEDVHILRVEACSNQGGMWTALKIVMTSAVFQDSDPDALPDVTIQNLYPAKGLFKPYGEF